MRDSTDRAVDTAQSHGVRCADIWITRRTSQYLLVRNSIVEAVERASDEGFGIRVLANGPWGFAAGYQIDLGEIDRVVAISRERRLLRTGSFSALVPAVVLEDFTFTGKTQF